MSWVLLIGVMFNSLRYCFLLINEVIPFIYTNIVYLLGINFLMVSITLYLQNILPSQSQMNRYICWKKRFEQIRVDLWLDTEGDDRQVSTLLHVLEKRQIAGLYWHLIEARGKYDNVIYPRSTVSWCVQECDF